MARQITKIMTNAFWRGESKRLSNTEVKDYTMWLFGNRIAWYYNGILFFTLCGWNTQTTRERLRDLGVRISQKQGKAYYNGEEINTNSVYEMVV